MPQISQSRLNSLLEKERAHDDYLAASRKVRQLRARAELKARAGENPDGRRAIPTTPADAFVAGYSQALEDFALALVETSNERARRAS